MLSKKKLCEESRKILKKQLAILDGSSEDETDVGHDVSIEGTSDDESAVNFSVIDVESCLARLRQILEGGIIWRMSKLPIMRNPGYTVLLRN